MASRIGTEEGAASRSGFVSSENNDQEATDSNSPGTGTASEAANQVNRAAERAQETNPVVTKIIKEGAKAVNILNDVTGIRRRMEENDSSILGAVVGAGVETVTSTGITAGGAVVGTAVAGPLGGVTAVAVTAADEGFGISKGAGNIAANAVDGAIARSRSLYNTARQAFGKAISPIVNRDVILGRRRNPEP